MELAIIGKKESKMEMIGFGIMVAAIVWGAIEAMKHFFPNWDDAGDLHSRVWLHDRLDEIEKDVTLLQMNYGEIVNQKNESSAA
jgi:hypothetical protein